MPRMRVVQRASGIAVALRLLLQGPFRAAGPVFQDDAQLRQPVADVVGGGEILLRPGLAAEGISSSISRATRSVAGGPAAVPRPAADGWRNRPSTAASSREHGRAAPQGRQPGGLRFSGSSSFSSSMNLFSRRTSSNRSPMAPPVLKSSSIASRNRSRSRATSVQQRGRPPGSKSPCCAPVPAAGSRRSSRP